MPNPADEMRTRHIAYALIQTPYKRPTRSDGLKFVGALGERGIPDLSYRYNENLQRDGTALPSLTLAAQEGRRKTEIKIDHFNGALRLCMNFLHPSSKEVTIREADAIHSLFLEQLGAGLDPQMVEAKVAVDIPTPRATAMANLGRRFFGQESLKILGNVDFVSVSLGTVPEKRDLTGPLDNPVRGIKVERLLEDPRRIFVETINQWFKMSQLVRPLDDQPGAANVDVFPGPLSFGEIKSPSDYVEEATEFIRNNVVPFILANRNDRGVG